MCKRLILSVMTITICMIFFIHFFIYYAHKEKTINFASVSNKKT